MLKLHLSELPAAGDEEQESLFPHTPRLSDRCFEAAVPEDLVVECLRPGSCPGLAAPDVDFLHRRCVQRGHAANDRKDLLMAHSWFQCAYACKGSMTELLSSTNMRLNLGQWHLCEALYTHIKTLELSDDQRAITERKHKEVQARIRSPANAHRPSSDEELDELLAAPATNASVFADESELKKLLGLLRMCGHTSNKSGDFEASITWFDCAHAISGAPCDLLSTANMRAKLVPTSAVALALYRHVLELKESEAPPSDVELTMAETKLAAVEEAREARTRTGSAGEMSAREYF